MGFALDSVTYDEYENVVFFRLDNLVVLNTHYFFTNENDALQKRDLIEKDLGLVFPAICYNALGTISQWYTFIRLFDSINFYLIGSSEALHFIFIPKFIVVIKKQEKVCQIPLEVRNVEVCIDIKRL